MLKLYSLAAAIVMTATASLAQESGSPEFVIHINEPFLTFETIGDAVTITSPNDLEGTTVPIERLEASGVTQIVGTYEGQRLVVSVVKMACTDDMAGLPYSHSAAMTWGETMKDGCARLTTELQPQESN